MQNPQLQKPQFAETVLTFGRKASKRVLLSLLASSTLLALMSIFVNYYSYVGTEFRGLNSIAYYTNVDLENSLPAWFSSKLLFLAALALFLVYIAARRVRSHGAYKWLGLSLIFVYLSIDETLSIHERIGDIIREQVTLTGVFYFAWVIPFSLLLIVFLAFYAPFFLRLPERTRNLIALAGALYVGGALGVEVVGGFFHQRSGAESWGYIGVSTLEEWLEMIGTSLFIFALLDYQSEGAGIQRRAVSGTTFVP